MRSRTYAPRRASAQWLEGAPPYVLDCWDDGGRSVDRYTVFIFGDGWGERGRHAGETRIPYLAMNGAPTHPLGFSQFGEMSAADRAAFAFARSQGNRRIRWRDLPEDVRAHVVARCGGSRRPEPRVAECV